MKSLLAALLSVLIASVGHAGDLSKTSFTGIWWGSQVTNPANPTECPHWLVERKGDGTFRSQGVTVDPEKKLYFLVEIGVGTWDFKDGVLNHLFSNGLEWKAKAVHGDGKLLRWKQKRKSGWDAVLEKCSEEPLGTFSVPLGKDYRQVTEKEFHGRNGDHREPSPLELDPGLATSDEAVPSASDAEADVASVLEVVKSSFKKCEVAFIAKGGKVTIFKESEVQKAPRTVKAEGVDLIVFERRARKTGANETMVADLSLRIVGKEVWLAKGLAGKVVRAPLGDVQATLKELSQLEGFRPISLPSEE